MKICKKTPKGKWGKYVELPPLTILSGSHEIIGGTTTGRLSSVSVHGGENDDGLSTTVVVLTREEIVNFYNFLIRTEWEKKL